MYICIYIGTYIYAAHCRAQNKHEITLYSIYSRVNCPRLKAKILNKHVKVLFLFFFFLVFSCIHIHGFFFSSLLYLPFSLSLEYLQCTYKCIYIALKIDTMAPASRHSVWRDRLSIQAEQIKPWPILILRILWFIEGRHILYSLYTSTLPNDCVRFKMTKKKNIPEYIIFSFRIVCIHESGITQ